METISTNGYSIRKGDYSNEKDMASLVGLLKMSFPKANRFNATFLNWQYNSNPVGKVVAFDAFDANQERVAHYACIPIRMQLNGRVEKGLLSLNTATHPDHRGKRLFSILADKTYNYAADKGFKFVIGAANANSTHGFLKNLGFYLISPLEVKVGIGNIYSKGTSINKNHIVYDQATLEWRLGCPIFTYTKRGSAIYGSIDKPLFSTSVGLVPEGLSSELPPTKTPFSLYVGLGIEKKGGVYINLPKFIKRSPFNLIFRDLTNGELPKITKENIVFQLLDFDVA